MNGDASRASNGSVKHTSSTDTEPLPLTKKPLRTRTKKRNVFVQLSSTGLRLLLWSSVIYVLFRCPSKAEDLNSDTSTVCKKYVDLRSQLGPHVEPHYNNYLKPYVVKAQPHVDRFNEQFYTPSSQFVVRNYNTYAAPQVSEAQKLVVKSWKDAVQPRLDSGQDWVTDKYSQNLAPHVTKAVKASSPYASKAQAGLYELYDGTLIPLYGRTQPFVQQAYNQSHHLVVNIVWPHLNRAQRSASKLLASRVWPTLVILYGENVEPQVMRITERLGRYRDSKKLEAAVHAVDVSASITSAASSASLAAALTSSDATSTTVKAAPEVDVREKIELDLKRWQEKFAKAAGKGAEDLEERVKDIASRQVGVQAHGVGKALVVQLDDTVNSSIKDLKVFINTSIAKLPSDAPEEDETSLYNELLSSIKSSGETIRNRAVAVKSWKKQYDNETTTLVTAALQSTLEVIDNIREIGLQDIGLKWADVEGVTYKDWSKYHALKKSFDQWRDEVEAVAHEHQGLTKARNEGEAIQDDAMQLAEKAARELIRLKDVTKWKVQAHDSTEDFSTKTIPPRAAKVANVVLSRGSEEIGDALSRAASVVKGQETPSSHLTDTLLAKVDEALSSASSGASAASSAVSSAASTASNVVSSKAADVADAAAAQKPQKVFGGAQAAFVEARQVVMDEDFESDWSEQISSILEAAGDKASDLTSAISDALLGATPTKGTVESATSLASERYVKALSAASSVFFGTPQPAAASVTSVAGEKFAAAVTAASYAIYGTPQPVAESLASQASAAYGSGAANAQATLSSVSAVASSRLSEGLSAASAQYTRARIAVGLQPPPLHEQYLRNAERQYYEGLGRAHEQYSRFVDVASSAVYGTPTPLYKSIASGVSVKVVGTPAPAYESLLSQATNQYNGVLAAASSQYAIVRASASSMAGMSSKSPAEDLLASAASQYDVAFTAASEALVQAASSASVAIYGTSTGTFESISSVVSEKVIGKETPWNEAAASKASANLESLIAKASQQIYGSPTQIAQSAWSQAGDYAAQATDAAASQYANVREIISELVVGKEPAFTESVLHRFSSAYYAGPYAAAASASSLASEAYDSASSAAGEAYGSASSVISSVFTPPATLEAIIDSASEQFQAAVDAASSQIYGTTKGPVDKATSAVGDTYNSVQSAASEAIYGKPLGPVEDAQSRFGDLAFNAQKAVSEAIYGTSTGYVEGATDSAGSAYSQATSLIGENLSAAGEAVKDTYGSVASQVSRAIYGPEQGALDSASSRIAAAASSASERVSQLVEQAASAAAEATARVKDEL